MLSRQRNKRVRNWQEISEKYKQFELGVVIKYGTRFIFIGFSAPNSLSLVERMSYLRIQGVYLSHERFIYCFEREKEGPWMKGQRMIKKEWYLLVLSLNLTSLSLDYCVLTSFLSLLPTLAFNLKCLFNFPILLFPPSTLLLKMFHGSVLSLQQNLNVPVGPLNPATI